MNIRILIALYLLVFCSSLALATTDEGSSNVKRSAMIPTAKAITLFKNRIAKSERDLSSKLVLGQLYVRSAKEDDRFHDLLLAEEQFRNVLEIQSGHPSAMILLSHTLLAQHKFAAALRWSQQYLQSKPDHPSGLAIQFDSQMQLGRYIQAKKTIDQLVKTGETSHSLVRLASYYETFGEIDKSLAMMQKAVSKQSGLGDTSENNAWFALRYAQMLFDSGRIEQAERQIQTALKFKPDYPQALALMGQIQWSKGHESTAIDTLRKSIAISEEPPVLVSLGDLLTSVNREQEATVCYQQAEQLMLDEEKDPIAGPPHARERAVYFSNHNRRLDHAVALAADDLNVRSDIHAHDVLAWALHQAGRPKEALTHARLAMKTNSQNAGILFHSGMIEIANGHIHKGRAQLSAALKSNPFFSKDHARQIRRILSEK